MAHDRILYSDKIPQLEWQQSEPKVKPYFDTLKASFNILSDLQDQPELRASLIHAFDQATVNDETMKIALLKARNIIKSTITATGLASVRLDNITQWQNWRQLYGSIVVGAKKESIEKEMKAFVDPQALETLVVLSFIQAFDKLLPNIKDPNLFKNLQNWIHAEILKRKQP